MYFPVGYTVAFMVDVIVGWSIAGLAIAALIRPQTAQSVSKSVAIESKPEKHVDPQPQLPVTPVRNDAINLLATLQREARLVDIVNEPLADYTDAQVGAAARDVLRDCGVVFDRLFKLKPIIEQEEGANIEIPPGADSTRYRISGSARGTATSGSLVHHGWQATKCELPRWTGSKESALIVSPAELEVK
jgi:hypothetical protein